jgi:hypothetical protein
MAVLRSQRLPIVPVRCNRLILHVLGGAQTLWLNLTPSFFALHKNKIIAAYFLLLISFLKI